MYIVQIASECAPVSKVGGLADVVYGISRELEMRGNVLEIILPKYDCMRYDHIWGLHIEYQDFVGALGQWCYSLLGLVWLRAWAKMFFY